MSPNMACLRSKPMMFTIAKPRMRMIKVLGGGCLSNWHWSNASIALLLLMLSVMFLHNLENESYSDRNETILLPKKWGASYLYSLHWAHKNLTIIIWSWQKVYAWFKQVILHLHLYHYFYCAWTTQYPTLSGLYKFMGPWRSVHFKFIFAS